ncbi:MAG: 2-succinyl-5-enolpyruvyl-6-hydroxy-3-cyclohexene-1-carboxylate synthase, partial [Proteobacteria bacterium]|nr:2-succinyl-5-enolpyruvyl-6-hydroxy-3-cyclohexene-1-carboxylate synthase [Pseudomonadota bacterium]
MTYTDEKHVLILLSLLKAHDIKKFIISPGSNNIPISGSVQSDSYFEVYSAVDERSAAYIAVGMAENSGEPVVLSCTGATASRNYMPGLTEAYYRKLPVIAITSFNGNENIGHLVAQNIDRTRIPNDVAIISVHLPVIRTKTDHWECNTLVNKALIESKRNGGGPVHINISSLYTGQFNVKSLPNERVIHYLNRHSKIEGLGKKKIGIFVGSHRRFTDRETHAI